ncbi:MAG: hypothetical protein QOH42_2537 [Blastocatellia bacterium]|nr:hypothetical protein [Blastocatellia bacterium]
MWSGRGLVFLMTLQQLKPGLLVAIVLAVLTSLPQIYLCYERGSEWEGEYAYFDTDELAYSAYVNALINDRPRRNDPYTGDNSSSFETLFSIQCFPSYSVAIPARILRISASTAFIILTPIITIACTLILFTLLFELTGKSLLSALGAGAVLCFGGFFGQAPWDFFAPHLGFPFLRRCMPAFGFPFFLAIALYVWRALVKNSVRSALLAGLLFIILIYSYFYLWTAVAAWLMVLSAMWLVARPTDHRSIFRVLTVVGVMGGAALVPYVWLLAHRSPMIDQSHLLDFTHRPDLLRGPEVYGAVIILTLLASIPSKDWRQPKSIFTLSFVVAPFVFYNQQLLTGCSLQPFHYDQFVTSYWILIAAFLALGLARRLPRLLQICLSTVGISLALGYANLVAAGRLKNNLEADRGRAVAFRLNGTGLVFASEEHFTNSLATTVSNPVLWARYMFTFSLSLEDQRLRFFKYLYYSNIDKDGLRSLLERERGTPRVEIFGAARANPILTRNPRPITPQDIEQAVAEYGRFSSTFGRADAVTPLLSYAIVSPTDDLSNLDKWYERDAGERVGAYNLYRLKLRE